jgi:hypothetical protein
MQDTSDQFATPEEEEAFNEEIIATDSDEYEEPEEEAEEETEEDDSNEEESEPVKPSKPGFVKFDTPEQQARADQLTREKHENHRKYLAEKSAREALAREVEELKRPAPPQEVPVPDADPVTQPDLFARQQQERDKYIRESTKYEAETQARNEAKQQAEAQKQSALLETYQKNIARLKVNPDTLHKASQICTEYGIGKDLVEHLLEDQDGPAIVAYLGNNLADLSEIVTMKPARAAAYIEREIRAKLNVKKQSKAPPPPTKVSGTRQSSSKSADGWSIS